MISVVGEKRQPLYHQSKQQGISGAENPPSIVHSTSNKEQLLIVCGSTNILTEQNIKGGYEFIRLN